MRFLVALPLVVALLVPMDAPPVDTDQAATSASPSASPSASRRTDLIAALAVLHDWDSRRARAWRGDDEVELRSVYTPGSRAGRADLRLLRAYRWRGFVVCRLVTQVFAVQVLRRAPRLLRISVFDRVAGGEVGSAGHSLKLRSTRPVTRTVEFRLVSGSWRVAAVSGSGPGPRAAPH